MAGVAGVRDSHFARRAAPALVLAGAPGRVTTILTTLEGLIPRRSRHTGTRADGDRNLKLATQHQDFQCRTARFNARGYAGLPAGVPSFVSKWHVNQDETGHWDQDILLC